MLVIVILNFIISILGCNAIVQQQINSLVDIYESTNGNYWHNTWNLTKLQSDGNACEQFGVLCDINDSMIIGLVMKQNNLSGTIPSSIQYLVDMQEFVVTQSPNLVGSIPNGICNWTQLSQFILVELGINGTIPTCIDKWTYLTELELDNLPFLEDSIPESICNISSLEVIYLNQISSSNTNGTLPSCIFTKLTNLKEIVLAYIYYHVTIPNEFCLSLNSLETFVLYRVPNLPMNLIQCIGNLSNLKIFEIFHMSSNINNFTFIDFKNTLCKLSNLEVLWLQANTDVVAPIDECIGDNLLNLIYLNFWYMDSMYGTIPSNICNLKNLTRVEIVHLSYNFSGSIPNCLLNGELPHLEQLGFSSYIPFHGYLDDLFCNLINLTSLIATDTKISGSMPKCIKNMTNLRILGLQNNALKGTVYFAPNIQYLLLDGNSDLIHIDSPINAPYLRTLTASNTKIKNNFSQLFEERNTPHLKGLNLHDTEIYDDDATETLQYLFNLTDISFILIGNNKNIHGQIPEYNIKHNQSSLQNFMFHNCDISGSIPNNLHFTSLQNISLFNNRLSCGIPNNFIFNNTVSSYVI
eukprot:369539_1